MRLPCGDTSRISDSGSENGMAPKLDGWESSFPTLVAPHEKGRSLAVLFREKPNAEAFRDATCALAGPGNHFLFALAKTQFEHLNSEPQNGEMRPMQVWFPNGFTTGGEMPGDMRLRMPWGNSV